MESESKPWYECVLDGLHAVFAPLVTQGDKHFDVNVVCRVKDKEILERARNAYSATASNAKQAAKYLDKKPYDSSGKSKGKGGGKGKQSSFSKQAWKKGQGKAKYQHYSSWNTGKWQSRW
jgi:hypothetical protein